MYTGKADRNAVYKTHKFFNRECKKGRSLFFLSVISAAAILAGTVLTGCRRADDLVQEQAEPAWKSELQDAFLRGSRV